MNFMDHIRARLRQRRLLQERNELRRRLIEWAAMNDQVEQAARRVNDFYALAYVTHSRDQLIATIEDLKAHGIL
jgi:hypothetical protein